MNTDMEMDILVEQNKWWKDKKLIEQDYDIVRWKEKKYKWIPSIIETIKLEPYALHIILGPRQVGKTTAIKLLIKKLLEEKNPQSIFYFNCEEISDYKELSNIIETYMEFKNSAGIKNSYIFLDEITSPNEWYKTIKSKIDKGVFKEDVLILTGSSSINIKRQTELFPGRRGKGSDYIMLPLSFREFLKVIRPEIYEKIKPIKELSEKELREKAMQAMIFAKELNSALLEYLKFGGFPLSMEENLEAKKVYLSWIKTEILKSERSDNIARQIIKSLLEKIQTPISWEGISKEIEIKSPKTVAAYVELLRTMFSLIVLYHADISSKSIKFGKNKKIHFLDPLLLEIFEDWCMVRLKNKESILAESVTAMHIARYSTKKYKTIMLDENLFYWRNSSEVDVVLNDNGRLKGFEVKWTDKFDIKQEKCLRHLKEFTIISKNKFSSKPFIIPLSIFLSILDV